CLLIRVLSTSERTDTILLVIKNSFLELGDQSIFTRPWDARDNSLDSLGTRAGRFVEPVTVLFPYLVVNKADVLYLLAQHDRVDNGLALATLGKLECYVGALTWRPQRLPILVHSRGSLGSFCVVNVLQISTGLFVDIRRYVLR